eukprot:363580-Chlamydomonas_euryale.AAC.4
MPYARPHPGPLKSSSTAAGAGQAMSEHFFTNNSFSAAAPSPPLVSMVPLPGEDVSAAIARMRTPARWLTHKTLAAAPATHPLTSPCCRAPERAVNTRPEAAHELQSYEATKQLAFVLTARAVLRAPTNRATPSPSTWPGPSSLIPEGSGSHLDAPLGD